MLQREPSKLAIGEDANMNKYVSTPKSKDTKSPEHAGQKYDETKKLMMQMEDQKIKNSYAFQIRFADKDRTVLFPKNEVDALSADIGIDIEHDKTNHLWFLQQALMSELPFGWEKEQDLQGCTIYHNSLINVTSNSHPNIHKFRIAFYDILKAENFKQAISDDALSTMTKAEKLYLHSKIESLSRGDREILAKKIRSAIGKDEENKANEIKKQLIKCKISEWNV